MFFGQRTQLINALRGHFAEHRLIAARMPTHLRRLEDKSKDDDTALLQDVRELGQMYLERIDGLNARIVDLDRTVKCADREDGAARCVQTMPGVRPTTARANETFAPELTTVQRRRGFASWLGLVPKQHSTGDKARPVKTEKMGQREIRALLVSGALAVLQAVERFVTPNKDWLIPGNCAPRSWSGPGKPVSNARSRLSSTPSTAR